VEEIFIPASGMAAEDVLVTEWLKQPGDQVAAGEPVAVVETDKAVVELSAHRSPAGRCRPRPHRRRGERARQQARLEPAPAPCLGRGLS
jgi:antitoxin (DNA-binding transcriptional repressor) of toxin-antitoxin stability system